jgi:hypothetical protein
MPFLTLDNAWSDLASSYNQNFSNKPSIPSINYNSFDDGLIRGGLLNAGLSSIRDTARIGKFFTSGRGVLFSIKQVGLQLSNPKLEQPSGSNTNFFSNLSNNNTRLYNLGLNTLAQVPINAFGGHIIRHGITPVGGVGFLEGDSKGNINGYNYEKIVLENNNIGNNRLIDYLDKIANNTSGTTPTNLLTYNGGASSVYGIGETKINTTTLKTDKEFFNFLSYNGLKKYFELYRDDVNTGTLKFRQDTRSQFGQVTTKFNKANDLQSQADNLKTSADYYEQQVDLNGDIDTQVSDYSVIDNYNNESAYLSNKANQLNKEASQLEEEAKRRSQRSEDNFGANKNADFSIHLHPDYRSSNIQSRIGVSTSKYGPNNTKQKPTVDAINAINVVNSQVFYSNSLKSNNSADIPEYALSRENKEVSGYFGRDIIKFRIEFLNNDNPLFTVKNDAGETYSDLNTDVLAFRAYLDDFSDGMNAKWNPYRYMGRGEEFYVYEGFSRDVSVAFTLHAHSDAEMKPIYQKLNYLMSSFAPDYSSGNKMRGNIGYLTVGEYLYRQPGVFTDIKLSGMLDANWEIAINSNGTIGNGQYEVPKHIKVALSFKPIHTFLPRKVNYKDGVNDINAPFITLDKKAYPVQAGAKYGKDEKGNDITTKKPKNIYLD